MAAFPIATVGEFCEVVRLFIDRILKNELYEWLYNDLIKAICFDVTNVNDYIENLSDINASLSDYPNLMPPAEYTWFEWAVNNKRKVTMFNKDGTKDETYAKYDGVLLCRDKIEKMKNM